MLYGKIVRRRKEKKQQTLALSLSVLLDFGVKFDRRFRTESRGDTENEQKSYFLGYVYFILT